MLDRYEATKKDKITAARRGGVLNIGEIGGIKAQKGGGNYSREERTNALEIAEKIKKRMQTRLFSVHDLFEKLDKDQTGCLDISEMFFFLQNFKKDIDQRICEIIFIMIDYDKSGSVTVKEFSKFFGLKDFEKFGEEQGKKISNFDDILTSINNLVKKSKKSKRLIFNLNSNSMKTMDFNRRLERIQFSSKNFRNFQNFIDYLEEGNKRKGVIDTEKLDYMLNKNLKSNNQPIKNSEMRGRRNRGSLFIGLNDLP